MLASSCQLIYFVCAVILLVLCSCCLSCCCCCCCCCCSCWYCCLHRQVSTNLQHMRTYVDKQNHNKADVVPLIYCRGHCIPLWAVFPSLQVVLSFACSVASLSRFPSHYLPCQLQLPEAATADYLFDRGNPSTWCAGLTAVHGTSSTTPPFEAQRGTTLPRYCNHLAHITFACLDF